MLMSSEQEPGLFWELHLLSAHFNARENHRLLIQETKAQSSQMMCSHCMAEPQAESAILDLVCDFNHDALLSWKHPWEC